MFCDYSLRNFKLFQNVLHVLNSVTHAHVGIYTVISVLIQPLPKTLHTKCEALRSAFRKTKRAHEPLHVLQLAFTSPHNPAGSAVVCACAVWHEIRIHAVNSPNHLLKPFHHQLLIKDFIIFLLSSLLDLRGLSRFGDYSCHMSWVRL